MLNIGLAIVLANTTIVLGVDELSTIEYLRQQLILAVLSDKVLGWDPMVPHLECYQTKCHLPQDVGHERHVRAVAAIRLPGHLRHSELQDNIRFRRDSQEINDIKK